MFSANTKDAANATVSDAKSTMYNAKRDLRDASDDTHADLSQIAQKAGRQVRGFIDSASDQLTDATDKVTGEIRSNPLRSSAIALGIGVVLGALIRR